eukprot:6909641-Alexandrium_andersonii.AAC.1
MLRILADDIMIATGVRDILDRAQVAEQHEHALASVVRFLQTMGARVSAEKSVMLASEGPLRNRLKRHVCPLLGAAIPVCVSVRDLGSQLNVSQRY